jgi:hypothetical protein
MKFLRGYPHITRGCEGLMLGIRLDGPIFQKLQDARRTYAPMP